ncbi:hypothetical protein GGR57DRAFT_450299 [Xylariaceae sp. FL1272]|nr:hypothetical protein GGR57DRAFT_450299 [Xylariaceae sp. FL1272]
MAPALDLSRSTHKMMVAPPRLNLRRAASYQGEKAQLSSTSARFSFNHLLFTSPPPSPGLPALVPRPRKTSSAPRPSRVLRLLAYVAGLVILLFLARIVVQGDTQAPIVGWPFEEREEYEMVGQDDLPEFPTPIAVTDRHGKSKWTVSIPPTSPFPLSMNEYLDICVKCHEVAAHVRDLHGLSQQTTSGYYNEDPLFLDVSDAEKRGLLPGLEGKAWSVTAQSQYGQLIGERKAGLTTMGTCTTSLTYVLESTDAGLGSTLMMLWMAYGLARKEQRAFFIDDSRWAYGKFTDIFQSPPSQDCRPPPRHQMLPCPRTARHLVVSAATAKTTFGQAFDVEYRNAKGLGVSRQRPVFELARSGFEALFNLNSDDRPYVSSRVDELRAKAKVPQGNNNGAIVGVHIRHGDVHPYEYQYNGAYIPLDLYTERSRELIEARHNFSTPLGGEDVVAKQHSFIVVASDNPDVYEADDFSDAVRAQEQIKLAGKQHADAAKPSRSMMHKFVDEAFGWEGGFYASMFWNLGRTTLHNVEAADVELLEEARAVQPTAEAMRLRGLIGRAYMIDLAVLAEAGDMIVCTVSAMGCRLLAVMMGWDKAMMEGNWVNVDGNFEWTGVSL